MKYIFLFIMQKIDIQTVLDEMHLIADSKGNTRLFGIKYIKSTGEIREMNNCKRNVKNSWNERKTDAKGKMKYNLKYKGVVLLYNEDTGEYRSIKAAHMVAFRPHGRKNWIPIWH